MSFKLAAAINWIEQTEIQMDVTGLPGFVAKVFFFHEPFLNHPFVTQELGPAEHQKWKAH